MTERPSSTDEFESTPARAGTLAPWWQRTACEDADPELFFVGGNASRTNFERVEDAKKYCGRCAVVADCLAEAIRTGDNYHVMGGMAPWERRQYIKKLAKQQRKNQSS